MVAPARSAMTRSTFAGMIRSLAPMRYQDGIVFQAGTPDGSLRAPMVAGRWVACTSALSWSFRPVANDAKTVERFRYRSVAGPGGSVVGTKSKIVVGSTESAESGPA